MELEVPGPYFSKQVGTLLMHSHHIPLLTLPRWELTTISKITRPVMNYQILHIELSLILFWDALCIVHQIA